MMQSNHRLKPQEESVLAKAIQRIIEQWEVADKDVAAILGVSPSVISRLRSTNQSSAFSPRKTTGKLALMLVRVYRSLGAFLGDRMNVQRDWLFAHNQAFNATPMERMKSPEGLAHVVHYLDAMRGAEG